MRGGADGNDVCGYSSSVAEGGRDVSAACVFSAKSVSHFQCLVRG